METVTNNEIYRFYRDILQVQSETFLDEVVKATTVEYFRKGQILIHAGDPITKVGFLYDGIFRCWDEDTAGHEATHGFAVHRGDAIAASFALTGQAATSIDAVVPGCVLSLPIEFILSRIQSEPDITRIYQQMTSFYGANCWRMANKRVNASATERYEWFCQEYPGMIEQVSNRYIASYLGITPVTLSRLRHGVATKKGRKKKAAGEESGQETAAAPQDEQRG